MSEETYTWRACQDCGKTAGWFTAAHTEFRCTGCENKHLRAQLEQERQRTAEARMVARQYFRMTWDILSPEGRAMAAKAQERLAQLHPWLAEETDGDERR